MSRIQLTDSTIDIFHKMSEAKRLGYMEQLIKEYSDETHSASPD